MGFLFFWGGTTVGFRVLGVLGGLGFMQGLGFRGVCRVWGLGFRA